MIAKEIRDEIIKHVKVGARLRDAAQAVGYTIEQVRAWKTEDVVFAKDLKQARIKCKIEQLERLSQAKGWQAPVFLLERKWPKEFGRRRPMPVRERNTARWRGAEPDVDFSDMTPEEMARLEGCFRKPRLLINASSAPAQTHDGSSSSESVSATPGEHTTGNEGGEEFNLHQVESRLNAFIAHAWPILEPKTRFIPGWHLDAIAEHLEAVTNGQIRNLLINVPPRHCKSLTVAVFWPVWEWIKHPERRWLFSAYASSLSIRDSLRCRRLIESPWFQENWSNNFQLRGDQNEKARFDNDKGGYRIATSVGGAATGEGGDRVVVDDPHAAFERQSDPVREAALIWWDETMSTRLNDPKTGARIIVMQRLHEKDLSGHVLEQGGYEHLCLPAEFDHGRRRDTNINGFHWSDPRMVDGQLLWPARLGKTEIAEAKLRLGLTGYAGQFQQLPVAAGGARFQSSWFRHYTLATNGYRLIQSDGREKLVPRSTCKRFAVMDPAGTEKSQNDRACYTVIQVWDVTLDHEMILVHQYREQVQTPDAMAAAVRIVHEFNAEYIAVEKDGLGLGMVQTLRRTDGLTVKPIKARGSKEARSEIAEIRMSAGMIYFPREAPWLWDLEQELLHFPNGEFADQVDALSHAAMQVQRLNGPPKLPKAEAALQSDESENSNIMPDEIDFPDDDGTPWETM